MLSKRISGRSPTCAGLLEVSRVHFDGTTTRRFYARPKTIADLVDHTVGKILDALGVDNETFQRWEGEDAEE